MKTYRKNRNSYFVLNNTTYPPHFEKKIQSEVEKGEAEVIEYSPPKLSQRVIRDNALGDLTHDFGDGRVIQTRPKDEINIRGAISLMPRLNLPSINWVMVDNKKYPITAEELRTAYENGQIAALQIWNDYDPEK